MPLGTELRPGEGGEEAGFAAAEHPSPYAGTHAAISVECTEDEIRAVTNREGWRTVRLSRGSFDVIEVWVENAILFELLTPEMAGDYLAAVRPG